MKVGFITWRFLDFDGQGKRFAGGIETYLENLAEICQSLGWNPVIFQCAQRSFRHTIGSLQVVGVPVRDPNASARRMETRRNLYKAASENIDLKNDILVFGGDQWTIPQAPARSIAIQHGIAWDYPGKGDISSGKWISKTKIGSALKKAILRWNATRDFACCPNRVCVDYIFPIWFKTQTARELKGRTWIIPNFGDIIEQSAIDARDFPNTDIGIIFARRFELFRGVSIMAHATKRLLLEFPNIRVTFAGNGSQEEWLRNYFSNHPRVNIIKYLPCESQEIHYNHQIAVVPSLASEGTTLSIAEALGAGCAVVATPVGGITNMILDQYNGLMVEPTADSLYSGIARLVRSRDLRINLSLRGYETAKSAFNKEKWIAAWRNVFSTVAEDNSVL